MRRLAPVLVVAALLLPVAPSSAAAVAVEPVSFHVENPLEPGVPVTVRGFRYRPDAGGCGLTSAILLVHGLSYGHWAWDFEPDTYGDTYSVARGLAQRGFAAYAIDLPGYGTSDHPNPRLLTVQSYASMMSQIAVQLEGVGFARVGIVGHSAGTEIAELAIGLFGGFDVLVATGYTHFPSQRIATDFITGDYPRAIANDYEYFGGNEAGRTEYMYNLAAADPEVVRRDNEMANLTPSGEVLSIGPQPSRFATAFIQVPLLMVLAENDLLFPIEYADEELLLFPSVPERTLHVVSGAGHSFMLHRDAPVANGVIGAWLEDRLPHC